MQSAHFSCSASTFLCFLGFRKQELGNCLQVSMVFSVCPAKQRCPPPDRGFANPSIRSEVKDGLSKPCLALSRYCRRSSPNYTGAHMRLCKSDSAKFPNPCCVNILLSESQLGANVQETCRNVKTQHPQLQPKTPTDSANSGSSLAGSPSNEQTSLQDTYIYICIYVYVALDPSGVL